METISVEAFKQVRQNGANWTVNSAGDFIVTISGVDFKVKGKFVSEKQKKKQRDHYLFHKKPPLGFGALCTLVRWHFMEKSQKDFGADLDVSQECISAWENGRNPVPKDKRHEMINMLMVIVHDMVDE